MRYRTSFIILMLLVSTSSFAQWNQFRGPTNDGMIPPLEDGKERGLPTEFTEANVTWKTEIHGKAWSTPVIEGDKIWMTTATENGKEMFFVCVDRNSGKILHDKKIFDVAHPDDLGNDVNTYGSCSPLIEGDRLYVHFGSYGTACIDIETCEVLWERRDLPCNHFRGPASSLVMYENNLILTMDGSDFQYQVALDKKTGDTVWRADRSTQFLDLDENGNAKRDGDFRKAYCTPLIREVNGEPQMFISVSYGMFSYDPRDGKELWRINHGAYSNAALPVFGNGMVYLCTGRGDGKGILMAVNPDARGDITDSDKIAWSIDRSVAYMVSPLLVDDLIYMLNNGGIMSCIDAKTGEVYWRERVGGQYYASPVYGDGKIYCFGDRGLVTVLKPGKTFEVLWSGELGDGFMASPAVAGKEFYLRSKTHLYRVENK